MPTEGPILFSMYGRQCRLDSTCEREIGRDREREVERGVSNPDKDDTKGNGRERLSPHDNWAPPEANERNVGKEPQTS